VKPLYKELWQRILIYPLSFLFTFKFIIVKNPHQIISNKVNLSDGTITFRFVGRCTEEQMKKLLEMPFYNKVSTDIFGRKTGNVLKNFVSSKNGRLYLEFLTNSGNIANAQNQMKVFFNHFQKVSTESKILKLKEKLYSLKIQGVTSKF
tara:strand:+ start:144 stop:590 length:447 start_codon:yes stop_codon:yes gene_type:complete